MDISVFADKNRVPTDADLQSALGSTYECWQSIRDQVFAKYPAAQSAWSHSGAKYGWGFRMKDKKRAIDRRGHQAGPSGGRSLRRRQGNPHRRQGEARQRDIERLIDIKLAH